MSRTYAFGPFRLIPAQHVLLEGDTPVRVGGRALELLAVLVERAGELVSKQELLARAWPHSVVEESNIKVAVATLRRALRDGQDGQRYLVNVSGRGYQFVAPVSYTDGAGLPATPVPSRVQHLPVPANRIVGRQPSIEHLRELLEAQRLVTILGEGGMGKTTVAIAVAQTFAQSAPEAVRFVDLSPLVDACFVPMAVAQALGLTVHSEGVTAALLAALADRQLLLVLDSCEHVLQPTAELVSRLLCAAPGIRVLATSREPLRAPGEALHRLPPLPSPPSTHPPSAREALAYPAVQLFVERATASNEHFRFEDKDAPLVAAICRKLDGVALAIELAATRADAFSLRDLSTLLDDGPRVLSLERRSAFPRHSSLAATLDWSYRLLSEEERRTLRRMSVFCGVFSLAAAIAVAGPDEDVVNSLHGLVSRSMVAIDWGGRSSGYRLLDTTRTYAMSKLVEADEEPATRGRHAAHLVARLTRAETESHDRPSGEWIDDHGASIDDVRAALSWSRSGGDIELGIALTVAAVPLWIQLSLLEECRNNIEWALTSEAAADRLSVRDRMRLQSALGVALLYTRGPGAGLRPLWEEALSVADQLQDADYQLRLLWSLSVYLVYVGDYRAALRPLRRYRALARTHGDRAHQLAGERLIATVMFYFGRETRARARLDRMFSASAALVNQSHITRFQFDQRAAARATLAHMQWIEGHADQAATTVQAAIEDAERSGQPLSLCNVLAHAALPIALYRGDHAEAEGHLARLREHLCQNALPVRRLQADVLAAILQIERGDLSAVDTLEVALGRLTATGFQLRRPYYLGALASGLSRAGRHAQALQTLDAALVWCEQTGEAWCLPELLRLKGELLRARARAEDLAHAEHCFHDALRAADRNAAPAWALRAATSLAALLMEQGRMQEALAVLAPARGAVREGLATADLQQADELLARISDFSSLLDRC